MAKFWYPKTCSERLGCILETSDPATLTGIAKTCVGHANDFNRFIGIPVFTGLNSLAPITGDQDVYDDIVTQNIAGTQESPTVPFLVLDEMRIGSTAGLGFTDMLVIYESSLHASGVSGEAAPDEAALAASFTSIKAANPGVTRVCLDQESWWTNGIIDGAHIPYYLTLIDVAHDFWPDVGIYSGIPERATSWLTGSGSYTDPASQNGIRFASWRSRCSANQQIFDAVNTIYPSIYYINPVYNNATHRDNWFQEHQNLIEELAPGKPAYYFMWPRIHNSVNSATPYIDSAYWRASLNKVYTMNPNGGLVVWLESANADPRTESPVPGWWTETLDFLSDNSIEEEA
jgi:hypothetical protein